MGYSPDWQKQNYAKGASTQKFTQKGTIVRNELFHNAPSRLGLADGGDAAEEQMLKEEGMAAARVDDAIRTKDMGGVEKFFDGVKQFGRRLTEGNIDRPGSEAYFKYGAGRGMAERDLRTPTNNQSSDYSGRKMSTLDEEGNIAPKVSATYPDEAARGSNKQPPPEPAKYPTDGVFSNPKNIGGRSSDSDVKVVPLADPDPIKPKARRRANTRANTRVNDPYPDEAARGIKPKSDAAQPAAAPKKDAVAEPKPVAAPKKDAGRTTDPQIVGDVVRRTGRGNPSNLKDPKYGRNRGKYSK